ncbi:MAG: hypothetical protein NT062_32115 [Proteobacteria bacterium]|nr:hypothetical protein [Pseudomonadota bacterium]
MIATVSGLDATSAFAQPEVRDHRTSPGPTVQAGGQATVVVSGHRRRPGPRFMMPLKIDIGAAGANTDRGFASGIGAAVGIHWASLSPEPTQTDVGVGVFGVLLGAPTDMTVTNDNHSVALGGAYLEVGHTLSHGDFWRTWATGRGEYLGSTAFGGEDRTGFGATGRLSVELFASGVGIEPRGVFLGTYALGLYVEAGVRDTVAAVGNFHAGAGITIRTPLVFAP